MPGPLLLAAGYVLLGTFLVAFLVRSVGLARLPVHLRWELAPVPKEKGRGRYGGSYLEEYEWWKKPREESLAGELGYMAKEIVFLKALWEHNRPLWWSSYPFHLGLYVLMALTGLAVLAAVLGLLGVAAATSAVVGTGLTVLAGASFVLGGIGALGLLVSRMAMGSLRAMTTRVAYFNLLLLLALFGTGVWAVVAVPSFGARALGVAGALLTADASVTVPAPLAAHVLVAGVFLAYLPFSQMMHFVAKYFTYHQVRWEDRPLEVGGKLESEVLELMQQRVTWSATHVGADGSKNWVDIATSEVGK